ncbi:MAG: NTP transferase domain-containing protein [Desulfobacteraceae bacterium]
MKKQIEAATIVFAAGKGSRMSGFSGNKTLLPLIPQDSPFLGERPILVHILENLPPGPKAIVVNHRKEDVIGATRHLDPVYCEQPSTNGTGGALLAASEFISAAPSPRVLITMGDVPFVRPETFQELLRRLDAFPLVVLAFRPGDKKRYGVLDVEGPVVRRIVEWEYWGRLKKAEQDRFRFCNSGIYAARKDCLVRFLPALAANPHTVYKKRNGRTIEIQEYFITDLVELMSGSGLQTGYVEAAEESEVMGVDDPGALYAAQEKYRRSSWK